MSKPWRVIENPDDGTSQWRARVVHGEGIATVVRAMFIDADVAKDYVAAMNTINCDTLIEALSQAANPTTKPKRRYPLENYPIP